MFTQPTTSSSTSNDPASPSARSRSSRLRGLSYLRQHTHGHHIPSDSNPNQGPGSPPNHSSSRSSLLIRSTSYPGRTEPIDKQSTSQRTPTSGSDNHRFQHEVGPSNPSRPTPETQSVSAGHVTGQSSVNTALGGIARIMGRRRSGSTPQGPPSNSRKESSDTTPSNLAGHPPDQMPTIKFIPHQDPRLARPSLTFPQTSRTLPHEECVIRVGRYSERDTNPNPPPNVPSSAPVGFKSKVVSRRHCEFWCSNGQWYIKDVKSSSGTFLNHIRLSQPSVESRPFPVNDGDVIQLGIDFRGGEEMIFRCVKIRVECNRAWQKTLNNFNVTTHKRLRDLAKTASKKDGETASTHSSECSICLMSIAPCQSLFVAPCSHVWHYRCIRPILNDHKNWPQFLCPNCRAVADLEADVDDPDTFDEEWEDEPNENGSDPETNGVPQTNGVSSESARLLSHDEDESMEAMSSRLSSVRIEADPSAALSNAQNEEPKPTLFSRRTSRMTSPTYTHQVGQTIPERSENTSSPSSDFQNYLRPITPTQPLIPEDDLTPNDGFGSPLRASTPSDMLVSDGPMTPTNNAGPFVFDGSAGRAGGRRTTVNLSAETESAA